jgi:hypothetical protein
VPADVRKTPGFIVFETVPLEMGDHAEAAGATTSAISAMRGIRTL